MTKTLGRYGSLVAFSLVFLANCCSGWGYYGDGGCGGGCRSCGPRYDQNYDRGPSNVEVRCDSCQACPSPNCGPSSGQVSTELLTIAKKTPSRACVGEPMCIEITVTARTCCTDITIKDEFQDDVQILQTEPNATVSGRTITWHFDDLAADETVCLRAMVKSDKVGCLTDCVTAVALPRVCTSTYLGKCECCLFKTGPECLCLGSTGTYTITIKNTGTAVAYNVVLRDILPPGLEDSCGRKEVEWCLGDIPFGECRTVTLCLRATQTGRQCNQVISTAANHPECRAEFCTEVISADIQCLKTGTPEQYIGREADYQVTVFNKGTSDLFDVMAIETMPPRSQVVRAEGADCCRGQLIWRLGTLKAGQSVTVNFTLCSDCVGVQCDRVQVSGCNPCCGTVSDCCEFSTCWKGHSGLCIEMCDTCDPILVGESTTYNIRISNQGTGPDANVRAVVTFPPQLEPQTASGAAPGSVDGQTVTFAPIPCIQCGECVVLRVCARARSAGDARVKLSVTSAEHQEPINQEESTFIY